MTQEALKLALEALDANYLLVNGTETHRGLEQCLDGYYSSCFDTDPINKQTEEAITAIKEALAQTQEPVAHWSDCAVHSEPAYPKGECDCGGIVAVADYTALSDKYVVLSDKYVALKAQPEQDGECKYCTDGCLACDARKLPPQRTWVGLTDEEREEIALEVPMDAVCITEAKLKEKNT